MQTTTEDTTAGAGPSEAESAPESDQRALGFADGDSMDAQQVEAEPTSEGSPTPKADAGGERERIAEQIATLKRREAELRRALAIVDHPDLADPIRQLEGRAFAVAQAESKMAQARSKAEERRLGTLQKKLRSVQEKRAKLDTQIAALEEEISTLGEARMRAFEEERQAALQDLLVVVSQHRAELSDVGLDLEVLVPELRSWMPEVEALAERLVAGADATSTEVASS